MIQLRGVCKAFNSKKILDNLSMNVKKGTVYGLVGPNGSGKSTILRLLCGVYQLDEGFITINDKPVYDNIDLKSQIFFVADDPYYPTNATLNDLKRFYQIFYPNFSNDVYRQLLKAFPISENIRINKMSKGMKRQAVLIIALASQPMYLFLDEAFDGLDPVMRSNLKKIISDNISERNMSVIISSHNLRELEDICDSIGLLIDGAISLEGNKEELKTKLHKVQIGMKEPLNLENLAKLNIMSIDTVGNVTTLVIKNTEEEIRLVIEKLNPLLFEFIPLSLEEIFINEMEANGYGKYQD